MDTATMEFLNAMKEIKKGYEEELEKCDIQNHNEYLRGKGVGKKLVLEWMITDISTLTVLAFEKLGQPSPSHAPPVPEDNEEVSQSD